ncbi:thrombomodulin-like [Megalops cyprinoides]|uniref:thrombomodulin-like n=1 Tax=Megalops cyprinoides TaxID=118141 RepID=UPI00186475CD|nr:thrombomodulin-like [Megalops cyprinoides]
MNVLIQVIAVVAFLLEVAGKNPRSCTCILNDCYTAIQDQVDFQTSVDACKNKGGHLMTVRTTVSSDVIHDFNLNGDFWIGLQLPSGRCSSVTSGWLRGYEWTTGDNKTDFTNWRSNTTYCSQMCVSVSRESLKWSERPCQDKIAGYLCENNYKSTCPPLETDTNESVFYSTPLGYKGQGLLALPPGTVATTYPSTIKRICAAETEEWLSASWSYDIDSGACEDECRQKNGVSEYICSPNEGTRGGVWCKCRDGFQLVGGKCSDINECSSGPCEHKCDNTVGGYNCSCHDGYRQSREDPHRCEMHCPSEKCEAICDRNENTQCSCPNGYLIDQRNGTSLCIDINECGPDSSECDHKCVNSFGSFICSCDEGFNLIDGHKCVRQYDSVLTTPVSLYNDFVTSSSKSSKNIVSSASIKTPGMITGIVLFLSVALLVVMFLVRKILLTKREGASGEESHSGDTPVNLQHMSTEKRSVNASSVDTRLKQVC